MNDLILPTVMSKIKSMFFCRNCGTSSPKWVGKCPSCNQWNTFAEEVVEKTKAQTAWKEEGRTSLKGPKKISEIVYDTEQRFKIPGQELNRVLGGGIVAGSLILLGGEPGIGKSTLMLQTALRLNKKVLYVSGEESENQVFMRAKRIGINNDECYLLSATETSAIFKVIKELKPELVIIDSIQTLFTKLIEATPGSVSQIRECAGEMLRFAKETDTPVVLIGHITKDGSIAGPKILEHMVDAVLQFEGDRHHTYRLLRTLKNRFGSSNELGIYEMHGEGLREVTNPSEILITEREQDLPGICVSAALEGMRPLLIETQALVSTAVYGTPQRNANGYDLKRLNMLLAVLEKRCGFKLGMFDVFVNIAGGLSLNDPAIDLSIACSILSSYENVIINRKTVCIGEIGLSGEIRSVPRMDQRIAEAEKLGFQEVILSKYALKGIKTKNIQLTPVERIDEAFTVLFG
jgi:DNA repair protein RadA/Sms